MTREPNAWLELAACRGMDPAIFYLPDASEALFVCSKCPVVDECRADADRTEEASSIFGVRAGETAYQRWERRDHPPVPGTRNKKMQPISHGTNAGYYAHARWGENPCRPCREAHNTHKRNWERGRAS